MDSKRKYLLLILLVLAFVITVTTSYAFFMYSRTGISTNTLRLGYIEFSMLDGESVSISNAFPQSDTDGNQNEAYTFTVNNNSTEGFIAYYNIGLVPNNNEEDTKYFTNDQIKFSLVKNGDYVIGSSTSGKFVSDYNGLYMSRSDGEGIVLSNQSIVAKTTDTFDLRIWISDTVNYSNQIDENNLSTGYFNDYKYSLKVKINAQSDALAVVSEEEIPDGYISLSLYYPSNATNKKWRIDNGSVRTGEDGDDWEDYTGPITVKLTDINNVYISYTVNGKNVVIPPTGKAVVDIQPNSYSVPSGSATNVNIVFDDDATSKQYSIDGGAWQNYTGEFSVSPNTLIEAKVTKVERVYDEDGNLVSTNNITNYDSIYINLFTPSTKPDGTVVNAPQPASGCTKNCTYVPSSSTKQPVGGTTTNVPEEPNYTIKGPAIALSSESVVESLTVTISADNKIAYRNVLPKKNNISFMSVKFLANNEEENNEVKAIYYKLGNDIWTKYENPITITSNTTIYSYYVTEDGTQSEVTDKDISNIKQKNRPYINGSVSYNNKIATVKLYGEDYEKLEYSLDGEYYQTYNGDITLDYNTTVYALATNKNGTTSYSLNVEIPQVTQKKVIEELQISIIPSVDKESLKGGLTGSTDITINYDEKATIKKYKVGSSGEWKDYSGKFTVEENCTVYAYAESTNGRGNASRTIDFLILGINDPTFTTSVPSSVKTPTLTLTINYDETANVKQYSIDGSAYIDYKGPITIDKNSRIEAKSSNPLGYSSYASYTVSNIQTAPEFTVISRKGYYLIKLNYPSSSNESTREYKFADSGWTKYNSQGILLVIPEYKEEILKNGSNIKIIDDSGKEVNFTGTYHLLTCSLQELYSNLSMRWNTEKPEAPTFTKSTNDPTKLVNVTIKYPTSMVKKLYKVITPTGKDSGWLEYNNYISVYEKGTMIYAKGENKAEVMSDVAKISIDNIDLTAPTITFKGDFTNPKRIVNATVSANDDQALDEIYYISGNGSKDSILSKGTRVANGTTLQIKSNGVYTFLATDTAGNYTTRQLKIENIDDTAPDVYITSKTEGFVSEAQYEINYGDSTTKQYKLGESGTWTNYTGILTLKSNDVVKYANSDFSLTIYAKGTDSAGNVKEVSETFYNLDLDIPKTPEITAAGGYPMLTEYGVEISTNSYIKYDSRSDTINYYSDDNGKTWKVYTKSFEPKGSTIMAKSVKKSSGLTSTVATKSVGMPSDALGPAGYDGDLTTCDGRECPGRLYDTVYINVDESMWGKNAAINAGTYSQYTVYGANNSVLVPKVTTSNTLIKLSIPEGTQRLALYAKVYEINPDNAPVLTNKKYYPLLTDNGVIAGHDEVLIKYFSTSVSKLYKINDGEWKEYDERKIYLNVGDTLYAKGIDKYGKETPTSKFQSSNYVDALGPAGYDGDLTTCDGRECPGRGYTTVYINVDESMWGKNAVINAGTYSQYTVYGANNSVLVPQVTTSNTLIKLSIPEGTQRLALYVKVYEINPEK